MRRLFYPENPDSDQNIENVEYKGENVQRDIILQAGNSLQTAQVACAQSGIYGKPSHNADEDLLSMFREAFKAWHEYLGLDEVSEAISEDEETIDSTDPEQASASISIAEEEKVLDSTDPFLFSASRLATTRAVALDDDIINRIIKNISNNVAQDILRRNSDQLPSAEIPTTDNVVEFDGDDNDLMPLLPSEPVEELFLSLFSVRPLESFEEGDVES